MMNSTATVKSCDLGTGGILCPNGNGMNSVQGYTIYCCNTNNCNDASWVFVENSAVILSILASSVFSLFGLRF
jgi:hypothetical protein